MRPSRAIIDLSAFRENYRIARSVHGGRSLAVLKANAYGHGSLQCAMALNGVADGFAVAFSGEAVSLRRSGISAPILLLEGVFDREDLALAIEHDLWIVVHQESQIKLLAESTDRKKLHAWLKIDSGMHRAGFSPEDALSAFDQLRSISCVDQITLMTHFSSADDIGSDTTHRQIAVFEEATQGIPGDRSLCNSAGILAWHQGRSDWGRPGIMLYGADPIPKGDHGLRPVMTLESEVFSTRVLSPGDSLGYSGAFVATETTTVGLVAIGYADGYPRGAPTGTPVSIDGRRSRIIGRVSMDMLTVDLTGLTGSGPGSKVQLWGDQVSVNEVAAAANTIAYELLCNVKRVPFVYN